MSFGHLLVCCQQSSSHPDIVTILNVDPETSMDVHLPLPVSTSSAGAFTDNTFKLIFCLARQSS